MAESDHGNGAMTKYGQAVARRGGNKQKGNTKALSGDGKIVPLPTDENWVVRYIEETKDLVSLCRKGLIAYINGAGTRMLGLVSSKRMVGRRFEDFVHPDYRDMVAGLLACRAGENSFLPVKFAPRKGGGVDAEVLIKPIGPPAAQTVIVQARDITEKLRSAEAVLRSETRYRHLVENSLDMICICLRGKVSYVNAAGVRMLKAKDAAQLIGRELTALVHPDYREIITEGMEHFIGEETSLPLKFLRMDRKVIDVEVAVMSYGPAGDRSFMMEVRDITERVRSAEALREREQRLRGIMDTVAEGIISIDDKGIIHSFNPAAEKIFGYRAGEVVGENVNILMPEPHRRKHDGYLRKYMRTGKARIIGVSGREQTGQLKDGSVFPLEISITELRHGRQRLFTGIIRGITERKRAEEELRRAHDDLEARVEERTRELTREVAERRQAEESLRLAGKVIDNLTEAVVIVDPDFKVTAVNPAFTQITGFTTREVIGKTPPFYKTLREKGDLYKQMRASIKAKGSWEGEFWSKRKNGDDYAERLSFSAITGEKDKVQHYAAVISDITERKKAEEQIHYQANYDTLTGLPNRSLFQDRLNLALPSMSRTDRKLALMFIDLDGFKLVNDTLGHDIGDLLLKETAGRLGTCVRQGDTVARLGGDEFTIIMPNLVDPRHAPLVGQRVLDALAKPFHLKGHETFVSASIGVTIFPDDASEAKELLRNADAAMYRAKEQGKANLHFFTADLNAVVQERMVLKNGLGKALEKGEFSLHYQPKLEIESGRITGVEALMRWNSPDLGMVSPVKFIPVMEETGQVVEMGEWAIRIACLQHQEWRQAGLPRIRIAVNLSPRQLRDASFVLIVESVLRETGVKPAGLELEITESLLMSDSGGALKALGELHEMGIHMAMDDFGTGYSSLSYLKRFPIDTIKIDRTFVADIATNPDDAEIIRTIISMGHTLNRKVIAEGVENGQQLSLLRDYQCDEIQGYFFSRPLPAGMITKFIKKNSP